MFNPLKGMGDMGKLVSEARKLQKELQQMEIETQKGRAEVKITADMKVKSVKVNGEEMNDLKDALNDALEKAQKKAAEKMQQMGGGLGGLLGR